MATLLVDEESYAALPNNTEGREQALPVDEESYAALPNNTEMRKQASPVFEFRNSCN